MARRAADIRGRTLTPDDALLEYLRDHGMSRISKRLVSSGALDVVATAAPGIKDILILGKVKQLERTGKADLLILDAPAAGHAITFLLSARALLDAVRVGPINSQARDVLEMLTDHERCQVMLVTLPEETPVNELVDTAYHLEDRVGVGLGPVVVNGLYPEIARARRRPRGRRRASRAARYANGEAASLAAAADFRLPPDGAAAQPGGPARRASSRCRSWSCRTCSTPTSDQTTSRCSPPTCSPASSALQGTGS